MLEPEVASRSLLGGALTVSRSEVLPFAAGRGCDAAVGGGLNNLLVLVLVERLG